MNNYQSRLILARLHAVGPPVTPVITSPATQSATR